MNERIRAIRIVYPTLFELLLFLHLFRASFRYERRKQKSRKNERRKSVYFHKFRNILQCLNAKHFHLCSRTSECVVAMTAAFGQHQRRLLIHAKSTNFMRTEEETSTPAQTKI